MKLITSTSGEKITFLQKTPLPSNRDRPLLYTETASPDLVQKENYNWSWYVTFPFPVAMTFWGGSGRQEWKAGGRSISTRMCNGGRRHVFPTLEHFPWNSLRIKSYLMKEPCKNETHAAMWREHELGRASLSMLAPPVRTLHLTLASPSCPTTQASKQETRAHFTDGRGVGVGNKAQRNQQAEKDSAEQHEWNPNRNQPTRYKVRRMDGEPSAN